MSISRSDLKKVFFPTPSTQDVCQRLIATSLMHGISVADLRSTRQWAEDGFISGSILKLFGSRVINTIVRDRVLRSKEVPLVNVDGAYFLHFEDLLFSVEPLNQPLAGDDTIARWGKISDYARFHSDSTVFITPLRQCIFFRNGNGCKFCTFETGQMRPLPPSVLVDMLERIYAERIFRSIAIGAGTPNLTDGGAKYFEQISREIILKFNVPISIEMIPPQSNYSIDALCGAGISSVVMSLELWDDGIREIVCPGKYEISKERYFTAWERCLYNIGGNSVSSVLLFGIEGIESTKKGISAITNAGVNVTLIPFRRYEASEDIGLEPPPTVEQYIEITEFNRKMAGKNNLDPRQQKGCTECGGCSIDFAF